MARLRRKHGTAAKGKRPLLTNDLNAIVALLPSSISGTRDKAILLIGFEGAMRRSKLVDLDFDDLSFQEEDVILFVRKSKTDLVRAGRKVAIPRGQHTETCPVLALKAWISAGKISNGPLFRPLTKIGKVRALQLSSHAVAEIVKKHVRRIDKPAVLFSGNSLRAGLATAAAMGGAGKREIQNQTGHKNPEMVRRYIRDGQLFKNNAFRKVDL